jgi:glycopeptide antibiotics resistance protein
MRPEDDQPSRNRGAGTGGRGGPEDPMGWPPPGAGARLLVGLLVSAATLAVLLWPFQWTAAATGPWLALRPLGWPAVLANIALFLPMGLAEARAARPLFGASVVVIVLVALDAALLSLIGESLQVWVQTRESGAVELACHTLGGAIGAAIHDATVTRRPRPSNDGSTGPPR